jgi:hypothetical protein
MLLTFSSAYSTDENSGAGKEKSRRGSQIMDKLNNFIRAILFSIALNNFMTKSTNILPHS